MSRIVIVGAGAAGLFAGGQLADLGYGVTLVEHMPQPAQKLCITGKGRCNLTNQCDEDEFLKNIRRNPKFLYSAIHALPPAAAMQLFEKKLSLPLKTERGRRVFPQSDKAEDVVQALLRYAKGEERVYGQVRQLLFSPQGGVTGVRLADGRQLAADVVLVATGGVSYPKTGSTGLGYELAKQAGHTIVPPMPSLVSLVEEGAVAKRMMGLALRNVSLTLLEGQKPVFCEQGEMLFTHFGLSGPLVLSASAYLGDMAKHRYTALIDLKPALTPKQLDARIQRDFVAQSNKDVSHGLDKLLPAKMRPVMLELWGVDPARKVHQITREERQKLGKLVKAFPVAIRDRGNLAHAVITAGGIQVKEVDPKTMQSRLATGLFFAGEVLDVDGYTGGYNLQIAWSTAAAAAKGIAAFLDG